MRNLLMLSFLTSILCQMGGRWRPNSHKWWPFCSCRKIAPKSKADFAFIMHSLNHLSNKGRAAIVCFPGIFYRGGAEKTIRQYLVDNNFIEAVIALPDNLFFGTSIATTILVLAKNKLENKTLFIDASKEFKKRPITMFWQIVILSILLNCSPNYQSVDYKSALVDNDVIGLEQDYTHLSQPMSNKKTHVRRLILMFLIKKSLRLLLRLITYVQR